MNRTSTICIALLLTGLLWESNAATPLHKQSVTQLEQGRDAIGAELKMLAEYSLRSGVGAIGYRSLDSTDPHQTEWVKIEFDEERSIDQIVMAPNIWRHAKSGFSADGFPEEFHWIAGTAEDTNGTVIARFTAQDTLLPRIAPVIVNAHGIKASWVKLVATKLSQRAFDQLYCLELAEIMVFSGPDNVALHQTIHASSTNNAVARNAQFIVDGFTPYIMNTAQGEPSLAFISSIPTNSPAILEMDLGEPHALDWLHLHAVEQSDTVPQSFVNGLALPRQMLIEGANQADFSDATPLLNFYCRSVYEAGPILIQKLPGATSQYIRFTVIDPFLYTNHDRTQTQTRLGFAEIELISNGKNMALGKIVKGNFEIRNPARSFADLTDGLNLYGKIIPQRDWMNELARRHDLEKELPFITAELSKRYARQKTNLRRMGWLAALLAVGIGFTILIDRLIRQRETTRIKERFAADLHDELGANLHAIGILGTHAKDVLDSPEKLTRTVDEIKSLTDRTGAATRYCTEMQTAKEAHENLPADLKRSAQRIIANLEYSLSIEGEEILKALKPRTRVDLFLFYKESLININRHADASQVNIQLTANPQEIILRISDNGCGIPESEENMIPASLKRRAKLLGAQVSVEPSDTGGTCIQLKFRPRKRLRRTSTPT